MVLHVNNVEFFGCQQFLVSTDHDANQVAVQQNTIQPFNFYIMEGAALGDNNNSFTEMV
jgi:hypothetical protein